MSNDPHHFISEESGYRNIFEALELARRKSEGWQESDAIKHYLTLRKDGYYQYLTTYQRWEGFLYAMRYMATNSG